MAFKGLPPTHQIKVCLRENKKIHTIVGRAWLNPSGTMSIQLNPSVVLSWKDEVYISALQTPFGKRVLASNCWRRLESGSDSKDKHSSRELPSSISSKD